MPTSVVIAILFASSVSIFTIFSSNFSSLKNETFDYFISKLVLLIYLLYDFLLIFSNDLLVL